MAKSPPHSIIPRPYTLTEQWYPIFFWNGRNLPLFHGTTPIKDSIYFFVHKIHCTILVKLWLNSTIFKITFTWCFLVQMGVFAIVNCCPPVAVMVAAEWYLVGSSSHLHDNQWSAIQPNPVLHGIKTAPSPFPFSISDIMMTGLKWRGRDKNSLENIKIYFNYKVKELDRVNRSKKGGNKSFISKILKGLLKRVFLL